MRIHEIVIAAAMVTALGAFADRAAAQPADSKAAAEQLFNQGRKLMQQGDPEAACPKFEASLEIDPALGTLLNLANCYEQSGRLASAWARYRELVDLAAREGQPKRQAFARERAAALEPRLPGLVIRVADGVPGLTVTRDGTAVERALLGTAVYVDPGEHEVVATAPGHEPFSTTVTAVEAEEAEVEIPALSPVAVAADGGADAAGDGPAGGQADSAIVHASGAADPGRTRRIMGMAVGGAGAAALVGGLGLGLSAISSWNDAFDSGLCERDTLMCTDAGQEQTNTARSRATLSNVLIGAGVGLAAAGVVLYLTAPEAMAVPEGSATRLVPVAGPDALGFAFSGSF